MIIETVNQFRRFHSKFKSEDCIVIPISSDTNLHPKENTINRELSTLTDCNTECNI